MKKVLSVQSKTNAESPKTPGGISKSLLTPCRRLGLSRNWRKSGPSPFISPLANENKAAEQQTQEPVTRKRKKCSEKEACVDSEDTPSNQILQTCDDSSNTPKRTMLQRKKIKTLIVAKENVEETKNLSENSNENKIDENFCTQLENENRTSKEYRDSSKRDMCNVPPVRDLQNFANQNPDEFAKPQVSTNPKQISPNNLTKECIVVIQNKILKPNPLVEKMQNIEQGNSQVLIDSDSEDIPLSVINKQLKNKKSLSALQKNCMDDTKKEVQVAKLEDKKTSTGDLCTVRKKKAKLSRNSNKNTVKKTSETLSQGCTSLDDQDDDDDFVFNIKRTILIKKTYDKVVKPVKAKSTGSITNNDIEEVKARIEAKKKLLLAKAITPETEDIRRLIKKWQKGCQDALLGLMVLMKKRMPEQNIENSELLKMLRIPSDLVGYDSENDCFNTPDDEQIVLNSLRIL